MGCKLVQLPCDTVIEYGDCRLSFFFWRTSAGARAHAHTHKHTLTRELGSYSMEQEIEMNTNLCHCITITDCCWIAWWMVVRIAAGHQLHQTTSYIFQHFRVHVVVCAVFSCRSSAGQECVQLFMRLRYGINWQRAVTT